MNDPGFIRHIVYRCDGGILRQRTASLVLWENEAVRHVQAAHLPRCQREVEGSEVQ
ncbi:hypothetical protein MTBLM5_670002 [Magnetospirillum sp. LM-5]|nr:hypothetical protein MTBLM5_670002 [Magnetospirillum sp. LM-5]